MLMLLNNDTPTNRPNWRRWSPYGPIEQEAAHLWRIELDQIEADEGMLSDSEHNRLQTLPNPRQRQRYSASRTALRTLLAQVLEQDPAELVFEQASGGKPFLGNHPDLHFNLSHSGSLALIGICRAAAVGVDIEPLKQHGNHNAIARRALPAECAERINNASDPAERARLFTHEWICFEARQKMTGQGIFGSRETPEHRVQPFEVIDNWFGAIAIASPTPLPIRFWQFEESTDAH